MKIPTTPIAGTAHRARARSLLAGGCALGLVLFAFNGCGGDRNASPAESTLAVQATQAWTLCATEYNTCTFTGTRQVKYGTETQYVIKTFTGSAGCDNGVFGDPAPGAAKSCWYDSSTPADSAPATADGNWSVCANENAFCKFSGTRQVRYGTSTQFVTKTFTDGVNCDNGVFGDPAPGSSKACWVAAPATAGGGSAGSPSTAALQCTPSATTTAAAAGGDAIEAELAGGDGTRLVPTGTPFRLAVVTRSGGGDTVSWQIADAWGTVRASGAFPVAAGPQGATLDCVSSLAGYFSLSASLGSGAGTLRSRGTRPDGIATFGVLPNVSEVLPPAVYSRQDQHRFGGQGAAYLLPGQACCTGDGYRPLYTALGLSWANDNRGWAKMEPTGPNTFNPQADNLAAYFKAGDLMRLIQLDGIPGWASPTGTETHSYAPKSLPAFQDYAGRVAQEADSVRRRYFPSQSANYYQVTWEPDYAGGLPWLDTDANFVSLFRAVWLGVHANDPAAVVMGTTNALVRENTKWLNRLVPLGLAQYLDGVTIHGYYDSGTSPSHPPERLVGNSDAAVAANALPASMRELRHAVSSQFKRGARLFVTETGISYDLGTTYGPAYPTPNVLYAHGAVVVRTHLILLGEGADVTYLFYASDIPSQAGYGLFFDLENAQGGFGPHVVSPKPAALGVAAMTRLIDGTNTLGPLRNLPIGVYGYAFERLGGGRVVTALWTHDNAAWSAAGGFDASRTVDYALRVAAPGTSGQVQVLDMMGNATAQAYSDGIVTLHLTASPLYVISTDATVMQANVTVPEGYIAQ